MRDYSTDIGDTLVKLCKLCREHGVDIRIRRVRDDFTMNRFELQLDRGEHHAVQSIDISTIPNMYPSKYAEYAFERAKYDIKQLQMKKEETC